MPSAATLSVPGILMQAQEFFKSRWDSPLSCRSYQIHQHSIISKKTSCRQMSAWMDPVSILEKKHLQLCTLFIAQHATSTCAGRHFKNIFKTALTKVFLNFARFGSILFFETAELLMEISQVTSTSTSDKNTVLKECQQWSCLGKSTRNLKRIYLGKYLQRIVLTNRRSWFFSILLLYLHSKSFHML